jgi:hypothetical protein
MAMMTTVVGNKEGNGKGGKGDGDSNNTADGYGNKGDGQVTTASMAMATAKMWAMAIVMRWRATKRAMERAARVMATTTRVAG